MSTEELPKGWVNAAIGQLVGHDSVFVDGDWVESKDQDPEGDVRLIQLADVGDGEFRDRSARFLTTAKAHELGCTFLEKGDMLIARMPDPLGRCCIFPLDGKAANVTVVDVCIVRVGSSPIDSKYLMYVINSSDIRNKISDLQSGSTRKRISRGNLATIELPVAPLSEQRRIVAKIEELFSELDKGVESLITARNQLDLYRLVILHQALSDHDGRVFPARPLNKLIGEIGQGWSPKCDVNTPQKDGEWAIIKTTAVQPMSYLGHECKPLPGGLQPRPSIEIRDDDLLMTRKGPRPRTGVVCHVRKARPHSMLCDTVYRFRAREDVVLPEFLEIALNAPTVVQEINARKSGISESGISLNHGKLESLLIPVPRSLTDQARIVQIVRERMSIVEHQCALVDEQIQRVEVLRQAILKRAFSGQLVAQDPADEPTSALLDRICAEREQGGATKRRNNKKSKKEAA